MYKIRSQMHYLHSRHQARDETKLTSHLPSVFFINITNLIQTLCTEHAIDKKVLGNRKGNEVSDLHHYCYYYLFRLFSPIKHFIWKATGERRNGRRCVLLPHLNILKSHMLQYICIFKQIPLAKTN